MFKGPLESDVMQKWGEIINKSYPNESFTAFSFVGLGSAVAVVEGLKAAGPDLTREKFIDAMNNIRDLDTGVLAGTVTFSPEDHQGVKMSAAAGLVDGQPTIFKSWGKPLN
jgi:branched-chain amino acid transport system substrate-binding protein